MYSGISVTEVATPALFTGSAQSPAQVVRLRIRRERPAGPLYVPVHGPGVATKAACQGRIAYGPAIAVRVSGVPDVPQG
ncbi:hypothetical protein AB0C90_18440 [Streptomyces sp. NPDC048550]|uniref:hypothetical protein n=1 Tax=unclassified Streptomyces TaxID=2593676 RepID=UPI003444E0AD